MADVHGSVKARSGRSHHDHWSEALDQALTNASGLGRTGAFDIEVRFWATIEVTNPGRIQSYAVTLTEKPPS